MHIANNIVIAFCLHAPSLSPPSTFANGAFLPPIRGEIMVNYSALPAASLAIISMVLGQQRFQLFSCSRCQYHRPVAG